MNITRTFPMVKLTDGVFILSCCTLRAHILAPFIIQSH